MSKMVKKNPKLPKISKPQKFPFFKKNKNYLDFFFHGKKCYPLSFPILGGHDSTRAFQSTLFQNPRGGPLSVTQQ